MVDTSAWIECLVCPPGDAWAQPLHQAFPERSRCSVPTLVQLELSKWLWRERGESQADERIAYTQKCFVVPLNARMALLAAERHRPHGLATAEAIICATAQDHAADLLTGDARFEGLPGVLYLCQPA